MAKFKVVQSVTVEADNPKDAAAVASRVIMSANTARYDVVDRMGYTFHVDLDGTGARTSQPT